MLKKLFKVKEMDKTTKDKRDETVTTYKAILDEDDSEDEMTLTSEKPIPLSKDDEVELRQVKAQQKISSVEKEEKKK